MSKQQEIFEFLLRVAVPELSELRARYALPETQREKALERARELAKAGTDLRQAMAAAGVFALAERPEDAIGAAASAIRLHCAAYTTALERSAPSIQSAVAHMEAGADPPSGMDIGHMLRALAAERGVSVSGLVEQGFTYFDESVAALARSTGALPIDLSWIQVVKLHLTGITGDRRLCETTVALIDAQEMFRGIVLTLAPAKSNWLAARLDEEGAASSRVEGDGGDLLARAVEERLWPVLGAREQDEAEQSGSSRPAWMPEPRPWRERLLDRVERLAQRVDALQGTPAEEPSVMTGPAEASGQGEPAQPGQREAVTALDISKEIRALIERWPNSSLSGFFLDEQHESSGGTRLSTEDATRAIARIRARTGWLAERLSDAELNRALTAVPSSFRYDFLEEQGSLLALEAVLSLLGESESAEERSSGGPARRSRVRRSPDVDSPLVEAKALPRYTAQDQPWWTPPQKFEDASWAQVPGEVDVVLLVATPVELEASLRRLRPLDDGDRTMRRFVKGVETYYVGRVGAFRSAVTMCDMGQAGRGASILAGQQAIDVWRPRAIVMPGIAFGIDPTKQAMADVLVASQVLCYESQRVGERLTIQRGPQPETGQALLNRFRNARGWEFKRPDGATSKARFGPLLSGEKLVDSPAFKRKLLKTYPQAIGGDMEAAGLYAAAARSHVEWIVAKGICDWGANKGDSHQELAAAAAVSLVEHVLQSATALDGMARARPGGHE